jgi:hypothetical protein
MRHDYHFVDHLVAAPATSIGRMIPIEMLIPNPDQPRKAFGNIADRREVPDYRWRATLPCIDRGRPFADSVH